MYTYNYSYGYSLGYGGGYNPYINYTWQMLPNAKVKNSGTSGVDLQLYSGNPLDFQGSQYISGVQIVDDIDGVFSISFSVSYDNVSTQALLSSSKLSILLIGGYIKISATDSIPAWATLTPLISPNKLYNITLTSNGSVLYTYLDNILVSETLCTAPITLNNTYTISAWTTGTTYYLDGQLDYLTISNRVLTQEEIELSNSNPNAFYDSMVNDANTLFATDFRGTAGYIADDKNNVVGSELVVNGTFDTDLSGWTVSGEDATHTITHTINGVRYVSDTTYPVLALQQSGILDVGQTYLIKVTTTDYIRGSLKTDSFGSLLVVSNSLGTTTLIGTASATSFVIYRNSANVDITIDNISVKEISAVYPITNYSATMRTNFQQEPTGLQDLTRSFDSLGFYTGVTDYLNCNGVGYGDTGWVPSASEDFTIEIILGNTIVNSSLQRFFGTDVSTELSILNSPTSGTTYCYIGGGNKYLGNNYFSTNKLLTIAFSNNTVEIFKNGVSLGVLSVSLQTSFTYKFKQNIFTCPLFKVHNKILTQEEITKNYNDYVAQGLLQ